MKRTHWIILTMLLLIVLAANPLFASLDEAAGTVLEGAVEFPVGLVKLVGGILWTVGEVIALPFKIIF